jgi:hypothetical protein
MNGFSGIFLTAYLVIWKKAMNFIKWCRISLKQSRMMQNKWLSFTPYIHLIWY